MPRPHSVAALAALLLVLLPGAPFAQAGSVPIAIEGSSFAPTVAEAVIGDLVTWRNHDGVTHTVHADDGTWHGVVSAGATHARVFSVPGEHRYHCRLHTWMRGSVAVANPDNARPTVAIAAPADGATIGGVVTVSGAAADADGAIVRVEVAVNDGAWVLADGGAAWSWALDTYALPDGTHALRARAFDGQAYSEAATLTFQVQNPDRVDLVLETVGSGAVSPVTHEIVARVRNAGAAAAGPFLVAFWYTHHGEDRSVGAVSVPGLAAGAAAQVARYWDTTGKVGTFPVGARADPGNFLVEADEGNNAKTGTAVVLVRTQPVDARDLR